MIRDVSPADHQTIAEIYNHYIQKTVITFEEIIIDEEEINKRVQKVTSIGMPWLVGIEEEKVVGYAYATTWNERSAYRHSVEVTVYLSPEHTSKGWGTRLYEAIFADLKRRDFHVIIAGVALPNPASVALHEKFGMQKVAHFKEVGFKFGTWLDVGYWQVTLPHDIHRHGTVTPDAP